MQFTRILGRMRRADAGDPLLAVALADEVVAL
jgi:hypothetical protein